MPVTTNEEPQATACSEELFVCRVPASRRRLLDHSRSKLLGNPPGAERAGMTFRPLPRLQTRTRHSARKAAENRTNSRGERPAPTFVEHPATLRALAAGDMVSEMKRSPNSCPKWAARTLGKHDGTRP